MRFEPQEETVTAVRDRLKDWGFVLNEPSARELVHTMLASEAPAIAAKARHSTDTALRAMRKIHNEILELIWRSAELAEAAVPKAPLEPEAEPIDLAQLVRGRLGGAIGGEGPKPAEDEPSLRPVPNPPDRDKRPLIKRPRR